LKLRTPNSELVFRKGMDTHSRYFRLRREDIAYFRFIMESCEGVAIVRTKDPREAVVELMIPPGLERDVEEILEGVRREIPIEALPPEGDEQT